MHKRQYRPEAALGQSHRKGAVMLNCIYSYSIRYIIHYVLPAPAVSQQFRAELLRKWPLVLPPVPCGLWGASPPLWEHAGHGLGQVAFLHSVNLFNC